MAGILNFHSPILILLIIFTYQASLSPSKANTINGFSIDLIHRDSPNSPRYNADETPQKRIHNAFRRGLSRLRHRCNMTSIQSQATQLGVSSDNGEYLMKFSIGNPPVNIYAIVDTGSGLMWTQCQPCEQCYNQINPIYNPDTSATYSDITCQAPECHLLDTVSCSDQFRCTYAYAYADASSTKGVLAKETITFHSSNGEQPILFQNIVFGCGHNNMGVFNENEMGVVGLGGTPLSLASQIGSALGNNRFSYCLVPFHTDPSIATRMYFGDGSEVIGDGVASTHLVPKGDKTLYFVTIDGISIGDKFLPYYSSNTVAIGNVIIDTGTPPTIFPRDFYNRLEQEVKNSVQLPPYQDDPELGIQLCYRSNTADSINPPILTVHFEGDAQVPLVPASTFISPKQDVFCFAMAPTDSDVGILGNFAQSNFRIGFDLDRQIVSFKQVDCTKE